MPRIAAAAEPIFTKLNRAAHDAIQTDSMQKSSLHRYWPCIRFFTAALCILAAHLPVAHASADEPLIIQLKWLHQFQFAGYYAALEKGYFAEEGLHVELRERVPSQDIVAQVLEGYADYGVTDSVLLQHYARGEPVMIVTAVMQHSANAIMALESAGITMPYDLVGRRLAVPDNGADAIDIQALLTENSIPPKSQVRLGWNDRLQALITGQVDAIAVYLTNEPYLMRELALEVRTIDPRHFGIDLYGDMLFTSRAEAELHPDRVAAVRRAVLRGWEYALDHKEELVELIYHRYNSQQKSRAALMHEALAMETLIARHTTPLGSTDPARVDFMLAQLQRLNVLGPLAQDRAQRLIVESDANSNALTADERNFIATLGRVRVAVEATGWPPFESFDGKGDFRGIAADYLKLVGRELGINFRIVRDLAWDDILRAARDREIDLLPSAASTPDRREYALFTLPYVRSPMVIVTRDDVDFVAAVEDLADNEIGVVGGYATDEMLSRYYPQLKLKRYDNTLAGLKAVASGDAYAFIDNLAVSTHLIRSHGLANLKISGQTPYSNDLSIGVRSDWPLLHSAIEKTLAAIPPATHQEIYDRWVRSPVDGPIPWHIVLPAALAAGFAIVLLGIYALRLRGFNQRLAQAELQLQDKNRQLQELSITDKLTGAFNRHHLDAMLAEHFERARRYNRPLSLVLFDLDHFKELNDRLGHQAGDLALQAFVQSVRTSIRKSDVFGRWGGEEFLLICPEADLVRAERVAEKIRLAVARTHERDPTQPTVSAGVADNRNLDSVDEFIRRADAQLYAAKLAGRNRVIAASGTELLAREPNSAY